MPDDERWLRYAIQLADESVRDGDYAFGTVIARANGEVLAEGRQTVVRSGDWLAHAEMNALRLVASRMSRAAMADATLYTSTEPCPMCTGAIGWSLNRLVYGLTQSEMYRRFAVLGEIPRFVEPWSCRRLLEHVHPPMEIVGPLLEEEAAESHARWMILHPAG
jgi:tRNA(adenine34) deaminase